MHAQRSGSRRARGASLQYDCVPKPTTAPDKAQLGKLGALAEAAAKHLNVKDPESVHKVNSDLKKVARRVENFREGPQTYNHQKESIPHYIPRELLTKLFS